MGTHEESADEQQRSVGVVKSFLADPEGYGTEKRTRRPKALIVAAKAGFWEKQSKTATPPQSSRKHNSCLQVPIQPGDTWKRIQVCNKWK